MLFFFFLFNLKIKHSLQSYSFIFQYIFILFLAQISIFKKDGIQRKQTPVIQDLRSIISDVYFNVINIDQKISEKDYTQLSCRELSLQKLSNGMNKDNKNPRRKAKELEVRDYKCKCGKEYLSYAAAYTHVKNKHGLEKDYVDNIKKPQREPLTRGRPKQKKQFFQNVQTVKLNLIQNAILKINQEIETVYEKTILQGNQERDQRDFNFAFSILFKQKQNQLVEFQFEEEDPNNQFSERLGKDFTCDTACKIKLISMILNFMEQSQEMAYLHKLNQLDLWNGHNKVNEIIIQTYKQWRKLWSYESNQSIDATDAMQ